MMAMRTVPLVAIAAFFLTICTLIVSADSLNPTYDEAIAPLGYEAIPLPGTGGFDVEIKVTSDIPVDMYVVTQEQLTAYKGNITVDVWEERYLNERSKSFTYSGSGAGADWVLLINDDPSQTANVHVEFKVLQETGEEVAKACCGSTIIAGIASLIGVVAILYALKKV